jgi:RNA polymerase sigma factor (sigma-70 family)
MRIHPDNGILSNSSSSRPEVEPLDETQRELAARYVPLALSIARKFAYGWTWMRDELESASLVALVEAARNFDPGRNVKFSTFLRKRLIGALLDTRKRMCQSFEKVDPLRMGDCDDAWGTTKSVSNLGPDEVLNLEEKIADLLGSTEDGPLCDVRDYLQESFRKLPNRHRDLMRAIYLDHRPIDEIAVSFGCSRSRLVKVHRESIDMLIEGARGDRPRQARRGRPRNGGIPFSSKTVPRRHAD